MHSSWCPGKLWLNQFWDWFSIAPYMTGIQDDVKDMLIIGMAGGTIAQQYKSLYPDLHIEGVEIDGEIVRLARKHFELDQFVKPEDQYVADGRTFLYGTQQRYDVIVVDAFRQPYIPFHLTTVEFFEQIRGHLKDNGVMLMNVNKARPGDHRLSSMVLATIQKVFRHTMTWSSDQFNDLTAASMADLDPEVMRGRMRASVHPEIVNLEKQMTAALGKGKKGVTGFNVYKPAGTILTDDLAPVELAWDTMFFGAAGKAE